jgi:hypothetical protein
MLARISIVFALLAGCTVSHKDVMTDHGVALERDPYDFQRTRLQTRDGAMVGFYALTVDPAKFPSELKPSTPGTGTGDLWLANPTTAWVAVKIEGTPVGTIGPLVDAVIKGAPNGTYAVTMTAPNGYVIQGQAETGKVPVNPNKNADFAAQ